MFIKYEHVRRREDLESRVKHKAGGGSGKRARDFMAALDVNISRANAIKVLQRFSTEPQIKNIHLNINMSLEVSSTAQK